jgi:protein ImuA
MLDPLQIPNVFRAGSVRPSARTLVPTGFDELDTALVGGWPHPALIEVLVDAYGIGEVQLLVPLLRALVPTSSSPLVLWLNPPYTPNAVALEQARIQAKHWLVPDLSERDVLWAAEQCLRSNASSAVLAWSSASSTAALRRLKLAAASTSSVGVIFRRLHEASQPSPATVRIALRPEGERLRVEIIKYEGRRPSAVVLDVRARSQQVHAS